MCARIGNSVSHRNRGNYGTGNSKYSKSLSVCFVEKYVVMPNHIHLMLRIEGTGRTLCAPTPVGAVPRIIKAMKETVTKCARSPVWQKGYHDHIVRGEADYLRIWNYIDTNPAKWREDCYYCQNEGV